MRCLTYMELAIGPFPALQWFKGLIALNQPTFPPDREFLNGLRLKTCRMVFSLIGACSIARRATSTSLARWLKSILEEGGRTQGGVRRHVFADGGYADDKLRKRLARQPRLEPRNHQAIRKDPRFRSAPKAMGHGTHIRMARSMPSARQGLGTIHLKLSGLGHHSLNPYANPTNFNRLKCFNELSSQTLRER
ncbi:hypothetical protein FHW96_003956 [Novosphingobium sp. SG751A]|nr:hypothetical protein [Novosphingobium sp. SG751A]